MKSKLLILFLMIASSLLTFEIHMNFEISAVLSSCIIALLFTLIPEKYGTHSITYCGSFIGMTLSHFENYFLYFFLATLIASIIYIITIERFKGLGGKLGSIAYISSLLTYAILRVIHVNV